MGFGLDTDIQDLLCKIDLLQQQLYLQSYKVKLPDAFTYTVNSTKHKMKNIRGYLMLSPLGEEVIVSFKVLSDKSVKIDSNINLLNSTLILF